MNVLERLWSNSNSHLVLAEMQNGPATLESSAAVSYRVKHLQLTSEQLGFKLRAGVHLYVDFSIVNNKYYTIHDLLFVESLNAEEP